MSIQRITCFKVKNPLDIPSFQDGYRVLQETSQKDGKPYILSVTSGPTTTTDDARAQGWNFVALARFASDEDVRYYDDECEAHRRYKEFARGKIEGPPLTVMMRV